MFKMISELAFLGDLGIQILQVWVSKKVII